ncbi:TRAP transporter small permease [Mycobacterium sp. NAZ190054]|uniref:TRAP transporter small permease n=1 Tax=Mycobacterium sp. NAZ190054 TaxID=1747766 RepID=UPI00079A931A|nr:TRAP transporter small permease subunit [Mycobacterium sp. NAZ190054]KWX57365.1 hypothetical protein ASJ79_11675 [Mycobacterium sp. NAZ190054]
MTESATADVSASLPGERPNTREVRLQRVARVLDVISTSIALVCGWTIAMMLLAMLVAATLQVASRYWLNFLVGGTEELARLSMVTMVFLGLPVLARYSDHIKLDVANEFIHNARAREWLARFALFMELVFLAVLAVLAYEFVAGLWHSQQQSPALGLRIFWSRVPIFIGAALAVLVCACVLLRRIITTPEDSPESLTAPAT